MLKNQKIQKVAENPFPSEKNRKLDPKNDPRDPKKWVQNDPKNGSKFHTFSENPRTNFLGNRKPKNHPPISSQSKNGIRN